MDRTKLVTKSATLARLLRAKLVQMNGAPISSLGLDELILHAIEASLESGQPRWATTGNTLVTATVCGAGVDCRAEVYVTRVEQHARIVVPMFEIGDRVRLTSEARCFLGVASAGCSFENASNISRKAASMIAETSRVQVYTVTELNGNCVRLHPPVPDFMPEGFPVEWLEKLP